MIDDSTFPTRDGVATGKANERKMLDRGGMTNDGFRTDLRTNIDGSTTMLRTRGGSPEFSTQGALKRIGATAVARGFIAHAPGVSYSALFNPYSLNVEDRRFSIISVYYHVSEVAASPYLPRKWLDVWSWDGAAVRINGQPATMFSPFRFPSDVRKAIPYLLPYASAPIYGDRYQNSNYPKRIYAVGPEAVGIATDPKWPPIPVSKLVPESPRTERKAIVCGPALDRDQHAATLSQLYFTGASWDSVNGSWEFSSTRVAMLLTPPFLQATNSALATELIRPGLSADPPSSGQMNVPQQLPSTEVSLVATGRVSTTNQYTSNPGGDNGYYSAVYDWSGTFSAPLSGAVESSFSRESYYGEESKTPQVGDVALVYSATNSKRYDLRQDITVVTAQTVPLFEMDGSGVSNSNGSDMTGDADNLYWGQHYVTPPTDGLNASGPGPNRGISAKTVSRDEISGTSVTRTYEEQYGEFSVKAGSIPLVSVTFSREKSFGPKPQISPRASTMYAGILAQPPSNWYNTAIGLGVFNGPVGFQPYVSPSSDLTWIRRYHGTYIPAFDWYEQPPEAVAEINNKFAGMRAQFAAQTVYDNENSDGLTSRPGDPYYTATVNPDVTLDNRTLVWETRDYILFDAENGVRISVEGHFSATGVFGASAMGTLSVIVRIESPWGTATKTLYERTAAYADMLPEEEIGSTGRFAIPSPRIMALFAPAHREQGTFSGAAYITQEEVSNGASPAILVNFVLSLETYSFVGSDEPTDNVVHFVPCNLIEMLYAFIFSRQYGIDPFDRYPVSDSSSFSTIMAGLFGAQASVQFRDGMMGEWLSVLGQPYIANLKTEIYRI